ncbi:MAG: T9SS type A sorting domain-containing protein [Saprospiraceae bacterium]|uniref:T9SS type A sorting domain-containing protein n=1 Tax=Candidatus Opimibacter skivensis TaxID=2982028 RepID=A0A9D7SVE1_9BACT|nr:T9SS type A sorting domain-containing protein [Candidatus Opimibacter skivensis]
MKKLIIVALLVIAYINLNAQFKKAEIPSSAKVISRGTKSKEYHALLLGEITPVSIDLSWKPVLSNISIEHHSEFDQKLELIKRQKTQLKLNNLFQPDEETSSSRGGGSPTVGSNFPGNANTGTSPLDNSLAISNGGRIVSVANASIEFYNTNGSMTFSNKIDVFFNDPTITDICDPVVIYDSGADKFIFFAQECSGSPDNTNLLICFSKTNNPSGGWWKYKLTGDPTSSSTWFDYPKLAVSTNELYITGNSFSQSGNFREALLYQIEKNNGFTGGNINWQYWNEIDGNPFTLLPVSYGQQGNYGPGCYLVATESSGSSSIELYDLTDDMSSSSEQLNHYTISTAAYSPAGDGLQFGTSTGLDNGDCRVLSGFYLNGIIHFVFHSDYSNGYNGINYNRLDVNSQTDVHSMFGLDGYEYSYPAVASFASTENDKSVMIGFGRTASTIYPEIRVVFCDQNMNWGNSTLVRIGDGFSDYTASGGDTERWGDYTGIHRKHNNSTPTVWMSGMYGTTSNDWATWIAEITGSGSMTGIETVNNDSKFRVYPNPAYQEFKTEFELAANAKITIAIYDDQGKLVKSLFNGSGISGKNQFTFNTSNLRPGTYFISINSNNQLLKNEKIIIAD